MNSTPANAPSLKAPVMKSLRVQVQREFWEHRALWIAPASVAIALLVAMAVFGHRPGAVRFDAGAADAASAALAAPPFAMIACAWAGLLLFTAAILVSIYLLDCLYGERRDRSILFWKSLPVSDARTVLIKFLVACVIVPLGAFVLAAVSSLLATVILALRSPAAFGTGQSVWDALSWLYLQSVLLYGLIVALLWYAPYAAYLMLASSWARRWPSAWAIIPPVLLGVFEYMVFGTHHVRDIAGRSIGQATRLAFRAPSNDAQPFSFIARVSRLLPGTPDPAGLLASPQLWLGLLAAALMLALAIRLRRFRDDS
jgi:ABC-2 type transport system permease protein